MTVQMPEVVKSQGMTRLIVLSTAPASTTTITAAELAAGEVITCHVYGDFAATPTENIGTAPRKMCTRTSPQQFGEITYPINDVQYSYVPQSLGTPGAPGNEAFEALTPGTEKWLVEVPGLDGRGTSFGAGALGNLYNVDCGIQRRGRTGDGEFDEFSVTQSFVMADGAEPVYDIALEGDESSSSSSS